MKESLLQVNGMSCQHCVNAIENVVKELGGVAQVDLANKSVTVKYDDGALSLQAIKDAIEDQGYDVA